MPTIPEVVQMAWQQFRGGQLRAAEQNCRAVLQVNAQQPSAYYLLATIAMHEARYPLAIECLRRAAALVPTQAQLHADLGVAYYLAGDHAQAETACREALRLKPDYPEAHNNLGNVLRALGRHREAGPCFREALRLKPDYPEAHNNLGTLYLDDLASPVDAETHYREALRLWPDFPDAHNNLGNALRALDRSAGAEPCFREALRLRPQFFEAQNNLGAALLDLHRPAEAEACCRAALGLRPTFPEAHATLGQALAELGRYAEAEASLRTALRLKPDFAEAHNGLGNVLIKLEKHEEAEACFRAALHFTPKLAQAQNNLGLVLYKLGRYAEAETCYREALRLKPNLAKAHAHLGILHGELGRTQEAEACFREALTHDPKHGGAHAHLGLLLRGDLPDVDFAALREAAERVEPDDDSRIALQFGLGQVLDGRKDYPGAIACFQRGHAIRREVLEKQGRAYDPADHTALVDRLLAEFTPEFFARLRGAGNDSERPVFIIGLPRSGTTLTEQILASHSQIFGAGELNYAHDDFQSLPKMLDTDAVPVDCLARLDAAAVQRLAAKHLERLDSLNATAARVVDKMPDNYQFLGLLAVLFPRAKVIHCRRDLRDIALSCWTTNFNQIRWSSDPEHIAERCVQYRRLMAHWRRVLPLPLLEVDYEETVTDLEGVARRLVAWCGLDWEPRCLAFHETKRPVRTASVIQVRQPIYTRSVGRWKNYEAALGAMFARLEALEGE
jgi:tetratricopeptide (TPR) repeat protein